MSETSGKCRSKPQGDTPHTCPHGCPSKPADSRAEEEEQQLWQGWQCSLVQPCGELWKPEQLEMRCLVPSHPTAEVDLKRPQALNRKSQDCQCSMSSRSPPHPARDTELTTCEQQGQDTPSSTPPPPHEHSGLLPRPLRSGHCAQEPAHQDQATASRDAPVQPLWGYS